MRFSFLSAALASQAMLIAAVYGSLLRFSSSSTTTTTTTTAATVLLTIDVTAAKDDYTTQKHLKES